MASINYEKEKATNFCSLLEGPSTSDIQTANPSLKNYAGEQPLLQ